MVAATKKSGDKNNNNTRAQKALYYVHSLFIYLIAIKPTLFNFYF